MLNEAIRERIQTAVAGLEQPPDWKATDTDALYRQLFPSEVTLHDFRSWAEQQRAEQQRAAALQEPVAALIAVDPPARSGKRRTNA